MIVLAYGAYSVLGSDLLPEMDEGGFILDYIMPAGSSLEETNRVITSVEEILRSTPEVESTSRRTGLQLGLAAVTEANTGDIAGDLSSRRGHLEGQVSRGGTQIITAMVPLSNMFGYSTRLRSLTEGRATFSMLALR